MLRVRKYVCNIYDDPGVKLSAVSNSPDDLEQEHLGADDEAPAGLQDADEEAGAGRQYHLINHVNYCRQIYHMNISA